MNTRVCCLLGFIFASVLSAEAAVKRPAIVPRWSGAEIGEWTMDHDAALAQAQQGTNNVVVLFNGAWWCPHCQALENTVLTNAAWQAYVETNRLYLVSIDNPGRADQYWCWLRETNWVESVGLTLEQGEAEITNRYPLQTSYAVPGAPTNTVKGISYLRVGYPTLIVLRPDGSRLGRFTPLATTVSLDMVIRNMNQLLSADPGDEKDDYHQGATPLETPSCQDEEVEVGDRTLSETDAADWFSFDATAGEQWSFALRPAGVGIAADVKAQIFDQTTNAVALAERVMTPSGLSVIAAVAPRTGRYWLKISRAASLKERLGYHLVYWYGTPPATVQFSAPQVAVSENAASVSLTVNIAGAADEADVHVSYETLARSAKAGEDYVYTNEELVWGVGDKRPKIITIPLLADAVWEGDETFTVALYAVKNCEVGEQLSSCEVLLKEQAGRQPGKLTFEGAHAAVLVEGSNALFSVSRSLGADGAVTARVEQVQGSLRTVVATLVWTNLATGVKTFAFAFTNEPGFQADRASVLKLVPQGGATLASSAGGALSLTRRDDLMVQSFAEVAASPAYAAYSLAAVRGLWFLGYCSDGERDEAWLRSGQVAAGGVASLSSTLQGPGVLGFDWRLDGAPAALQGLVGGAVADEIATPGTQEGAAFAVPAGRQTVLWTVRGGAGAAGVAAAVRNLAWYALPQTTLILPANQAAVVNRGLSFSWQDVLAGLPLPAGVTVRYEFRAGLGKWALQTLSEQTEAAFPRAGNAADQAALDGLIAAAGTRPVYWRVDTVATDALGRRAVYAGSMWSVTIVPDGSPEFVASEGGYDPAVLGGVTLPVRTVGVYEEAGPFAVANADGGTVLVAVKKGALPSGTRAVVREGAVWITGVPRRSGQGSADLHVSVSRLVGGSKVTTPGTSVTVNWTVEALGRAAGQFNGSLVDSETVGYGNAAVTVSASGAISGRFVNGALTYSLAAPSFGGRADGAYVAQAEARAPGSVLPVTLTVAADGSFAELRLDGADGAFYDLKRNNWADADGVARLRVLAGYYTIGLPVLSKSSANAPGGTGYLTFTVKANGTVTYAGCMADGKAVSGSTVLIYGPDCCSAEDRVTFYILGRPSGYAQGSGVYGLVYLVPGEFGVNASGTTAEAGDPLGLRWVNTNPTSVFGYNPATGALPDGLSGFTNALDVTGGYYDKAVDLQAFYGGSALAVGSDFPAPADFSGEQGGSGFGLVSVPEPARLPAAPAGTSTLTFPKPLLVKNGVLVDFAASTNPWYVNVKPSRSTGVFTGSFAIYYQGLDGSGNAQQKTKRLAVKGVFLPVRATYQDYADWMGFYLLPDTSRYLDAAGQQKGYPFSWSYDFLMAIP